MSTENPFTQPVSASNSEAYLQELVAKYPTPESIVDDYRSGAISPLAMPRRFPDSEDQKLVERLVEERSTADRESQDVFRTTYIKPILEAASQLNAETIALITGEDKWEIDEFEPKLQVALHDRTDQEALLKMSEILNEMRALESSEDPAKKGRLQELADTFNLL